MALAQRALSMVDEVVFVLPRKLPHKEFTGASFDERIRLIDKAIGENAHFSVAASPEGLFIDIARECRRVYGDDVRLTLVCGRDAAERAANWEYGPAASFREMLDLFDLLVAGRLGEYQPPAEISHRVYQIVVPGMDHVSATEIRNRIRASGDWEHLVPVAIREEVRKIYR